MRKRHLNPAIWMALLLSLIAYHVSNLFMYRNIDTSSVDILATLRFLQFATLGTLVLAFVKNGAVARIILRSTYIGGKYKGKSHSVTPAADVSVKRSEDSSDRPLQKEHLERFIIRQNLVETKLEGKSVCENKSSRDGSGDLVSHWHGVLFKVQGSHHWFVVQLESNGSIEYGILSVVYENNSLDGIYLSTDSDDQEPSVFHVEREEE